MKKGQILEGRVERIDFPNKAVIRLEDRQVVVKDGLPGQKVRISVNKVRKGKCEGRILEVRATLHNVCPDKRVALAVLLSEVDEKGKEHPRGMKTVTVPVHHCPACRNVLVRGIRFILPEDLNVSGTPGKLCTPRNLRVRLFSHYVDYDFQCCNVTVTCKQ